MSIKFITDSASDIPQGTKGIKVVPLKVTFNEETFLDNVNLSHAEFYDKLVESSELPVTSQASPYDFEQAFKEVVDNGDEAIVVCLSSALSGTYQSACIAAEEFGDKIKVIDSLSVTVGQRILVEYGIELANDGLSSDEIVAKLEETKEHIHIIALLDTLEYLKKGGRISKTVAFAGNILSIKPVVTVKDGAVVLCGKARGSKQGNNYLINDIRESGGINFTKPYFLGYTGNSSLLLDKYIKDSKEFIEYDSENLPVMTIGGAIGTHVGPGAIAIAYIENY